MALLLGLTRFVPWWKWPFILSTIYLASQRKVLYKEHLHSRYAEGEAPRICSTSEADRNEGECIGDAHHGKHAVSPGDVSLNCTPTGTWPGSRARTSDGTCNDLNTPAAGSRFYRFLRLVTPKDHFEAPRTFGVYDPDPRRISRQLLERKEFKPATTLNSLAAAWIQFNVHDWIHHGENEEDDPHYLQLSPDDPLRNGGNADGKFRVLRTRVDRSRKPGSEADKLVTAVNNCTHWWDGSGIYGSTQSVENKVRSFKDGKLKLDKQGFLPVAKDGIEITGFNDNWWTGLSLMHTLFSKEHNAVCDMLKTNYPDLSDQRLFEIARLITSAIIAKIHTVEWTTALLSNPVLVLGMNANWHGFLGPNIKKYFGHTGSDLVSGLVGQTAYNNGVPHALSEEFTAIYRMHSLLRDDFDVYRMKDKGKPSGEKVQLLDMTFERHLNVRNNLSASEVLLMFGTNYPGALTLHNFPRTLTDITKPNKNRIDLATIDILRDRERMIPRYNHYRRSLNLIPKTSIDDLTPDVELRKQLKEMYDNDIEKVDLLVGGLAEPPPYGFAFSDTVFQAFISMASRRLSTDRFYTDDFTAEHYTEEGLLWIEKVDFRAVLLRHHPDLKPALDTVPRWNAFAPWKWEGAPGTKCKSGSDCDSGSCVWSSLWETTCA